MRDNERSKFLRLILMISKECCRPSVLIFLLIPGIITTPCHAFWVFGGVNYELNEKFKFIENSEYEYTLKIEKNAHMKLVYLFLVIKTT